MNTGGGCMKTEYAQPRAVLGSMGFAPDIFVFYETVYYICITMWTGTGIKLG